MQFDHFNLNQDSLMSIEELRALRLRKKKFESEKKARKYISEINQRYRKIGDNITDHCLKHISPLKKTA